MDESIQTISKYDRRRAHLRGMTLDTKPSTILDVDMTGRAETFVIMTARHPDLGDFIFVEHVDDSAQVTRLCLPPKVANAIASQRDSLTARRRSAAAKRLAQERKDRGEVPGFMKKKA